MKREKDDEYELLPKMGHHFHHNYHHTHSHVFGRGGSSTSSNESYSGSNRFGGTTSKRGKKQMWGSRERAGMSFLIVIAFFAVFGLIVLMEVSQNVLCDIWYSSNLDSKIFSSLCPSRVR